MKPDDWPPLQISYSEPAEAQLSAAYEWMKQFGFEVAEQWLSRLTTSVEHEASLLSSVDFVRPAVPRSPSGRTYHSLVFRTGKRGSSPWHIVYELVDRDEDGEIDTLEVVSVLHAARG